MTMVVLYDSVGVRLFGFAHVDRLVYDVSGISG